MALAVGARLGPYEILSAIGAGGMGEVYRAHDTRLDRTVAIKILAAADPDLTARFAREAKTIAALQHPHICTLFDVGRQDPSTSSGQAVDYLVLEYLEGETLATRLGRGPLKLAEALKFASEIADALAAAHRAGIVHRDLKPSNIMLTKSGVKLLDFSLAKIDQSSAPRLPGSMAVTKAPGLTAEGTILGTLHYMAPEQLEGKEADVRSDLFAFGAVVYEMVTSRKAFDGHSPASVIAGILERTPTPISTLEPLTPPLLDHVVTTCLAKNPEDRWQSAGDLKRELRWIAETNGQANKVPGRPPFSLSAAAVIAIGGLLAGLLIGAAIVWYRMRPSAVTRAPLVTRSMLTLAPGTSLGLDGVSASTLALSPDGTRLAYVVRRGDNSQIYVRILSEFDARAIAGTDGGTAPFFSPDGRWIGFFTDNKLKKVAVSGGAPQTICNCEGNYGASWGPDGTIIFSEVGTGLMRVQASGGTPTVVTKLDESRHEKGHRFPQFLPNGESVLFTIVSTEMTSFDEAQIAVVSLDTGNRRVLIEGGSNPIFASVGQIIYLRGGSLYTVPFDPRHQNVMGDPVPVIERVNASPEYGHADFTVASNGTLAYVPGGVRESDRRIVWLNLNGETESLIESRPFQGVRISPTGKQVAVTIGGANDQVWLFDLASRRLTRLTFASDNYIAGWSPDGQRIVFRSDRSGDFHLYAQNADGTDAVEQLTEGPQWQGGGFWARDGSSLVFDECCAHGWDIGVLTFSPSRHARPLIQTRFDELSPQISPEGRWIAYVSAESGRPELYVQPFPGLGAKSQISTDGASMLSAPVWRHDGRELFYQNGGKVMAVRIDSQSPFAAGNARLVFEGPYLANSFGGANFDIATDGRPIMIQTGQTEAPSTRIALVQNWFTELQQRVPTR